MVDVDQGMDTRCYGMKAQPPARIDAPEVPGDKDSAGPAGKARPVTWVWYRDYDNRPNGRNRWKTT